MEGYSVTVIESSKELSAKERVACKDTTGCTGLDEATRLEDVIIEPDFWVKLSVHNEKSKDKDYDKFLIVAKDGTRYVTGSKSFVTAFMDIVSEMDGTGEEYAVKVFRLPSRNYSGKEFLTCSIV